MELLRRKGYKVSSLRQFLEMHNLNVENVLKTRHFTLCYKNEDISKSNYDCMSLANIRSILVEKDFRKEYASIFYELYRIIGPSLFMFIIQETLVFETLTCGAFYALNPDKILKVLNAKEICTEHNSHKPNSANKMFFNKQISKCGKRKITCNESGLEIENNLLEQNSKKQCVARKSEAQGDVIGHIEGSSANEISEKAPKSINVNKLSNETYHNVSSLDNEISVLPRRKRKARKNKKKIGNHNRTAVSNVPINKVKKGYKEIKSFSTGRFIYCTKSDDTWFCNHVLNSVPKTRIKSKSFKATASFKRSNTIRANLIKEILKKDVGVNVPGVRSTDIPPQLKTSLSKFIENHDKSCHYYYKSKLLSYFKSSTVNKFKVEPVSTEIMKDYLLKVMKHVIPYTLLGSTHNKMKFIRYCLKFIDSCKFQHFRLGCLMRKMKITKVRWLESFSLTTEKENLLAKVCAWLVEDFVTVLIKSFFYVTEVSYGGNKLYFFLNRKFEKLKNQALKEMIKDGRLQVVRDRLVMKEKNKNLGNLRLRFLPKHTGCRPIIYPKYNKSEINETTRNINILLSQRLMEENCSYKFKLENLRPSLHKMKESNKPVYFVRTDIHDAFGSVKLDKLLNMTGRLIPEGQYYMLKKFKCITMSRGRLVYCYKYGFNLFPLVMPKNSILINMNEDQIIKTNDMQCVLKQIMRHNVMKIGNSYYLLLKGIPQGGKLSSVLCDVYYSRMDLQHLKEFQNDEDFFLRVVDDYLFVTKSEDRGKRFLDLIQKGFQDYNCVMNKSKTQTNVENSYIEVTNEISFYGYIIHADSLQVEGNFTKYAGQDVAHYMTLPVKNPGRVLQQKVTLLTTLKLDPICLDETYNSRETVLKNVFVSALFQAFRFHGIVHHLFDPHQRNQSFLARMIYYSAGKIGHKVTTLIEKNSLNSSLDFYTVCWITYRAYKLKIGQHMGIYTSVWRAIEGFLKAVSKKISQNTLDELERVTTEMPASFKTFK